MMFAIELGRNLSVSLAFHLLGENVFFLIFGRETTLECKIVDMGRTYYN